MTKWSPQQQNALLEVDNWFKNESKHKHHFYLAGWAGTGKTTLAKHFAENVTGEVKFATYTGKAAHVMEKKGCIGATTIHRLIYQPKAASKKRLFELEQEIENTKSRSPVDYDVLTELSNNLRIEQENTGRINFALNSESDLQFAKLLIIDEVSMINKNMALDLLSFNVPILVLGDPEQLPPIYGTGYFTDQHPDIMLDEIHRQALDNPIIAMSKLVREGNPLSLGQYGDSKVINTTIEGEEVLSHDIILTGIRKTKKACDDRSRSLLKRTSTWPQQGDRVMCIKNNHSLGLLNGQIWVMQADSVPLGGGMLSLNVKSEDTGVELIVTAAEKLFQGIPLERFEHDQYVQEFEYAYAITVHKSQGSQWDNVLLFDQKDKFPTWSDQDRRRWLYTGITRAAERVTVMRL